MGCGVSSTASPSPHTTKRSKSVERAAVDESSPISAELRNNNRHRVAGNESASHREQLSSVNQRGARVKAEGGPTTEVLGTHHTKPIDSAGINASGNEFAAEGSSSTARLSVNSASFVDATLSPPTRCIEPSLPFFSGSILAPHAPGDAVELQRRLTGGYTDPNTGIEYLTAAQRWTTLLEETRVAEGSHLTLPNFLTGGGVLWEDLVEGLPVPLPTPTPRVGTESLMPAAKQSRVKFLQKLFRNLLLGVSAAIPNYDEEALLADCDVARYTIERCAFRFKEFYAWCNETAAVNPNYVRMRTILGQLQVSLRNTAILLEDPKRYLEAFARIDPQGVMFQAEVLSLQDDRMMKRDKVEIVPAGQPQPQGRGATANPLQESFLDNPIGSDEVRLCATKARDIVSMMNKDSTNPTSASNSSAAPQVHVALRLFRQRAFKQLRYIMLILQNLVEIESFYLRDRWTSVEI